MDPLISVITVYRDAEDTLNRVFDSILRQSSDTAAEFIFVDDASADRSAALVAEFAAGHPELAVRQVSMPEHPGLGRASKATIDNVARGEYIMRLDADDSLADDALSTMLSATEGGTYDIVVTPFAIHRGADIKLQNIAGFCTDLNRMPVDVMYFSLCNKLVRRSLLTRPDMYLLPDIECWEDLGVTSRIYARRPKVATVDRALYNYILDPNRPSLTRDRKARVIADHIAMAQRLEQWFEEQGLADEFAEFLTNLKFHAKFDYIHGHGKNLRAWKATFPEVNRHVMSRPNVKLRHRLVCLLASLLPIKKQ